MATTCYIVYPTVSSAHDHLDGRAGDLISCGIQQDDTTLTVAGIIDAILPGFLAFWRRGTRRSHTFGLYTPRRTKASTAFDATCAPFVAADDTDAGCQRIHVVRIPAVNVCVALTIGEAFTASAVLVLGAVLRAAARGLVRPGWIVRIRRVPFTDLVASLVKGIGIAATAVGVDAACDFIFARAFNDIAWSNEALSRSLAIRTIAVGACAPALSQLFIARDGANTKDGCVDIFRVEAVCIT